ncbi:MAG: hypothetical protein GEU99_08745 [Luteitalea sp.]|nr:hypothetical protein [Luteitalea sp.]
MVQDDGTTAEQTFIFESFQRQTFRISDHFPALENQRFSILVESVGLGEDFIATTVEYARYQSTEGRFANGGGSALATVIPYP